MAIFIVFVRGFEIKATLEFVYQSTSSEQPLHCDSSLECCKTCVSKYVLIWVFALDIYSI